MKTLITNDDGVTAYGLQQLHKVYQELGNCLVVAPDNDCSGVGQSLTLDRPLRVKKHSNGFVSVNGTPTDCIYLALRDTFDCKFSRVVSGINKGSNLGDDILYSGTVAAAMEGRWLDKTSIAISSCGKSEQQLETSARVLKNILPFLDELELPKGNILNINIPAISYEQIAGYQVTVLGKRKSEELPVKTIDPRGNIGYWIGPAGSAIGNEEGTDFYAIANNCVSITPLQYDKTNRKVLSHTEGWLKQVECQI